MKAISILFLIAEIFLGLFFTIPGANAQSLEFDTFCCLKSKAPIPNDFLGTGFGSIQVEHEPISKLAQGFDLLDSDRFVISSNLIISRLLEGGKILFNDPVSNYLNLVADTLLKTFPELRKALRFFAVKSPEVNAISTEEGIIFVNLGLVSRCHNEAELAFVLAHEIFHFIKKHKIVFFIEEERNVGKRAQYQGIDFRRKVLREHFRSAEMELEADSLGFQDIFSRSPYDLSVYNEVFNILQFTNLPIQERKFEMAFFESDNLKIPEEYWLDQVRPINLEVESNNAELPHKDILKRRTVIKELADKLQNNGRKLFANPEADFQRVKMLATCECLRQWIIDREYAKAFVNARLLLYDFPDNEYIQSVIAWCLFGLTKYKNAGRLNEVMDNYRSIEGESQRFYFLFSKLKKDELSVIALNFTWRLHKKFPDNKVVEKLSKNLFDELTGTNKLALTDFQGEPDQILTDSGRKINRSNDKAKPSFIYSAFTDLLTDPVFMEEFLFYTQKNSIPPQIGINNNGESIHNSEIGRIVVVHPFCLIVDERDKLSPKFRDSYEMEGEYRDKLQKLAHRLDLKLTILAYSAGKDIKVEDYNELSLIREWISERLEHEVVNGCQFMEDDLKSIVDKFQTPYFCLSGIIIVRAEPDYFSKINSSLFYSALFTPVFGLPYIFGPEYYTQFINLVFDVRTGEQILSDYREINKAASDVYLNSNLYDILSQFKSLNANEN